MHQDFKMLAVTLMLKTQSLVIECSASRAPPVWKLEAIANQVSDVAYKSMLLGLLRRVE